MSAPVKALGLLLPWSWVLVLPLVLASCQAQSSSAPGSPPAGMAASAPPPASPASSPGQKKDSWQGTWTGKWDAKWKVRFTVTPSGPGLYRVLYEWQEDSDKPEMNSELLRGEEQGDTLRAGVMEFGRTQAKPNEAIVIGRFAQTRRASVTRKAASKGVTTPAPPMSAP